MGVTVYRGVTGFGKSGETHASALLDLSFDLPVVVEFFDTAENVKAALDSIGDLIAPGHVLTFPADFS
jgi:PII-like signaling protein